MSRHTFSPCILAASLALSACASDPSKTDATPPPTSATEPEKKPTAESESPKTPESSVARSPAQQAVDAPDRSEADRELDPQRAPVKTLDFFEISPGQRVAELAAGKGYTAELLARVVGKSGVVYGQNNKFILERFAEEPWSERLKKPEMANVVRVDRELEAPLPPEAKDLDAVLIVLFYHDTIWFKTDRAAMNRQIFEALKPGGIYGIVDHSARPGDGVTQVKTLHRIEESTLRAEVEAAGFELAASADFLRNTEDARDWSASPSTAGERRGQSDRFVLKFVKPLAANSESDVTVCTEPRRPMCTRDYRPVCAQVDTGVRCVKAPCPSTEKKTYSNACTACADEQVVSHEPGACEATTH